MTTPATQDVTVSVIIPTFQRSYPLQKAVDSVLAQTHAALEILVVDDGSGEAWREYPMTRDARLRVIRLDENSGSPAHPRNVGVQEARGDWVAFLDSDDVWMTTKLSEQLAFATKYSAQAVASNAYRLANAGGPKDSRHWYFKKMPRNVNARRLMRRNLVITSTVLVRRDLLLQCMGFPLRAAGTYEDLAVWLRVASISPFYLYSSPLAAYSDNPLNSFRSQYPLHVKALRNTLHDFRRWRRSNPCRNSELAELRFVLSEWLLRTQARTRYAVRVLLYTVRMRERHD